MSWSRNVQSRNVWSKIGKSRKGGREMSLKKCRVENCPWIVQTWPVVQLCYCVFFFRRIPQKCPHCSSPSLTKVLLHVWPSEIQAYLKTGIDPFPSSFLDVLEKLFSSSRWFMGTNRLQNVLTLLSLSICNHQDFHHLPQNNIFTKQTILIGHKEQVRGREFEELTMDK